MNKKRSEAYIKRLLIIPARGGSKRIPGKNLIDVCGSPIIRYPIEAAITSSLFDEIVVSSDSDEILSFADKVGNITISKRPDYLAEDFSTIFSTLKYEYLQKNRNGFEFNEIWLLSATACLIGKSDLVSASKAFVNLGSSKAMLAVTEYEVPVQWAMSLDHNNKLKTTDFASFRNRSQDLQKFYHDAGCLAIFSPEVFNLYTDGVPDGIFDPYILDRNKAIDIDNYQDLDLVRALMAYKKSLI